MTIIKCVERNDIYSYMKQIYRDYLLRVMPYVKLSYFVKLLGLNHSNLSNFLKGDDSKMSIDNLKALENAIKEKIA